MSEIRILPDNVINQIAAGEVVERPAAVVKELVENAIDAGGKKIAVEFDNGGKTFICVEDDGEGMTSDQVLIALERHATSKLRTAEDLDTVLSMGFRGEALPSIASVSRFTVQTRKKGHDLGSEVLVDAGRIIHQKEHGMQEGTRVSVERLFHSVPARRKFLKQDTTEAAHIIQMMKGYALVHPEIGFTLKEKGRVLFSYSAVQSLEDRVRQVLGKSVAAELTLLNKLGDEIEVQGMIAKPGLTRSTRQEMLTFINGRPVQSKELFFGICEGYEGLLAKGRYPIVVLLLKMDPKSLDVNVHPAKREVRFRSERKVQSFVTQAIREVWQKESDKIKVQFDRKEDPLRQPITAQRSPFKGAPSVRPMPAITPKVSKGVSEGVTYLNDSGAIHRPVAVLEKKPVTQFREDSVSSDWRYLSNLQGRFVLFESESGLVVLNIKAAKQRILFERVLRQSAEKDRQTQTLLFPISLQLDLVQDKLMKEYQPLLSQYGFVINEFGRQHYRLEETPIWLEEGAEEAFIFDFLLKVKAGESPPEKELKERFARLAATHAFRRSEMLDAFQAKAVRNQLFECDQPLVSPFGKKTYREIGFQELEKS